MSKVLLIGFESKALKKIKKIYDSVEIKSEAVPHLELALEKLGKEPPVLVVASFQGELETLRVLDQNLKVNSPTTPFLVTMTENKMDVALQIMKAGAFDCLSGKMDPFQILAASKRATLKNGRTLFSAKLYKSHHPASKIVSGVVLGLLLLSGIQKIRMGAPPTTVSLGSASLSGLQWDSRDLWVGSWMDSTITQYRLQSGILPQYRELETVGMFRLQDTQPILVCNTPEALVTIGFDLKFRSHQRVIGLPTLQAAPVPGTNPTGLVWDGEYLWSIDKQTSLIYRHGGDFRVIETIPSIIQEPTGLAWDGKRFWIIGDSPLKAASFEKMGDSYIWRGPYLANNLLAEGVEPSGLAAGFDRLWVVSGGDPRMNSKPISALYKSLSGWKEGKVIKEKKTEEKGKKNDGN
ncbi:MAG: hypothetical protein ACKVQC_01955 [Elusimicrobiota bacterium]